MGLIGNEANKGVTSFSWRGPFCRCAIASEWNVEGGRLYIAGFFEHFFFSLSSRSLKECWIDGLGRFSAGYVGMRVSLELPPFLEDENTKPGLIFVQHS